MPIAVALELSMIIDELIASPGLDELATSRGCTVQIFEITHRDNLISAWPDRDRRFRVSRAHSHHLAHVGTTHRCACVSAAVHDIHNGIPSPSASQS